MPDTTINTNSYTVSYTVGPASRFSDLRSAGRQLALALAEFHARPDVIVLGLAFGGLPVAHEVAGQLALPLDFVFLRRLLAPQSDGIPLCAVNVAGSLQLDEAIEPPPAAPQTALEHFLSDALAELAARADRCRAGRLPRRLRGQTVLLVDCGICGGGTMRAALRAVRQEEPAAIIAAVPVASAAGCAALADAADRVIRLAEPEPFGHVGFWYEGFHRPGEDQVSALLGPVAAPADSSPAA